MNTKKLFVDSTRLVLLIEERRDLEGKVSFVVTSSLGKIRFRELSSLLDFINSNKDLGYIC